MLAVLGTLAGCTSGGGAQPATLAPVTSLVVVTTSGHADDSSHSTTPSAMPTSSAQGTPEATAVATAEVTSVATDAESTGTAALWPADFTPAQAEMARAAIAVYVEAWRITDAVLSDPDRDWEPEVRKVMSDPVATETIGTAASLSSEGMRAAGSTEIDARVSTISGGGEDGTTITIDACVDIDGSDLIDANGVSVLAPLSTGPRFKQRAEVIKFDDQSGGWLLSATQSSTPLEPC